MKGIIAKYLSLPEIHFETSSFISSLSSYCLCKSKNLTNTPMKKGGCCKMNMLV